MYKILLVDDEEIFLEYMCQAIDWNSLGCQICSLCEDGESALAYILENRPDIVFMDISIPRMNGLEVCEHVRARNIPTILVIMSAHDEFKFAHKAIKLDAADYLLKPFTEKELESTLKKVLEKLQPKHPSSPSLPQTSVKSGGLIDCIENYIQEHYHEPDLTIDRMAEALQFENSYLRRVYKRSTGITITQRIDELRIQHAKELLERDDVLNREIASKVGYSDQYYFSRRFKQICGETPTEFRIRRKKES